MFNWKISLNSINIINLSLTEKYLEEELEQGWLLDRILFGIIFIFKRVESNNLNYSVVPLFMDLERKDKRNIDEKEFGRLIRDTGWDYLTKSGNFQIYYKEQGKNIAEVFTDEESKYEEMKNIVKDKLYFSILGLIFMLVILSTYFPFMEKVNVIRELQVQIIIVLIFLGIFIALVKIFYYSKFLYENKDILGSNREISYIESVNYNFLNRVFTYIYIIGLIAFFITFIYFYIILNDRESISLILSLLLPVIFIFFISKRRKTWDVFEKKKSPDWGRVIISIIKVTVFILILFMVNRKLYEYDRKFSENIESNYIYLEKNDFKSTKDKTVGSLIENKSIFIKEGFNYISDDSYQITTEYTETKSRKMAERLFKNYLKGKEESFEAFERTIYSIASNRKALRKDLSKKEYIRIETDKEIKKNISRADEKLWKVDEVYFLSIRQDEILLRKGKKVYKLKGVDFSDDKNRMIVMEKFGFK